MGEHSERVRRVRFGETSFVVEPFDRGQRAFWDKFDSGTWEADTLSILGAHLDRRTTFVDIGSWIGPTALFAAAHAKRVIALEPDPVALRQLRRNISLNPDLAPRIKVFGRALYPKPGLVTLGSTKRGGDSKSSIAHEQMQTAWEVDTITPMELAGELSFDEKIFLKIDIEGGEYAIGPYLAPLLGPATLAVHLSLHPKIAIGGGSGLKRLARVWEVAQATGALVSAFRDFAFHEADGEAPKRREDIERLVRWGLCYRPLRGSWLLTRDEAQASRTAPAAAGRRA